MQLLNRRPWRSVISPPILARPLLIALSGRLLKFALAFLRSTLIIPFTVPSGRCPGFCALFVSTVGIQSARKATSAQKQQRNTTEKNESCALVDPPTCWRGAPSLLRLSSSCAMAIQPAFRVAASDWLRAWHVVV
eukprot:547517-Rhodomonas_salina.2